MALNGACPFASAKRTILHKLRVATDYSPKGSVDAKIVALIQRLNALPNYATTSSCSGRVALYCHDGGGGREDEGSAEPGEVGAESAKGCGRWLLVEHGAVTAAAVAAALREAWPGATAVLKVEPFILHVQARDMASAVRLLAVATRAGFRESGIVAGSSGRGKLIVAVRSTAGGMDSPLQWEGQPLVRVHGEGQGAGALDAMFVQLVAAANARMAAVEARRARFEAEFEAEFTAEAAAAAAAEAAGTAARSMGSVACAQCSAQFASRNQLFSRHLVRAPGGTRPVCPSPAAPAGAAQHTCLGCGHSASSRNALFRHVAACTLAPPQRAAAAAAAGPAGAPPEGSSGVDAEAVAARSASRALLQRVREGIAATAAAAAALPLHASDHPTPLASGLLRRWGHCTMPLPDTPSVLVFGGSCGESLHGRRNDLLLVNAESGHVGEVARAAGSEAPPPRVRATLVPLTPHSSPAAAAAAAAAEPCPSAPASATPATTTTLALLFGGHCGPAAPLGDVWLLRFTQGLPPSSSEEASVTAFWVRLPFVDAHGAPLPAASAPCARYGHTLCATSEPGTAILFGGREYGAGLGDCWRLRLTADQRGVCAVRMDAGALPAAPHPGTRFSHAAATLLSGSTEYMLVHGGFRQPLTALDTRGAQILSDCWALDCVQGVWRELPLPPPAPLALPFSPVLQISTPPRAALARFSHSLTLVQGGVDSGSAACMLLLLGGECIDPQRVGPLFIHLSSRALPSGEGDTFTCPGLDFSSALCSPGPAALTQLGYGGCVGPAAAAAALPALNPTPLLLQHTATVVGKSGRVLVVGGGGVCFAFGSTFSPSLLLPSAALPLPPAAAAPEEGCGPLISLPPALAQAVKAEVQALGWFDLERKVGPLTTSSNGAAAATPLLGVPLTNQGYEQLLKMGPGCSPALPSLAAALAARTAALLPTGCLPLFNPQGLGQAHRNDGGPAAMHRASLAVRELVTTWGACSSSPTLDKVGLDALCTPGAHPGGMPRRIEWLADVLLLPEAAFTSDAWGAVLGAGSGRAAELWGVLGGVFHATRLARGARIDAGGTRASHLTMLLTPAPPPGAYAVPGEGRGAGGGGACAGAAGQPLPPLPASALASLHTGSGGWVRVKEGGLCYALDATRVMFSSGNVTEKARMGALACQGQTVVDLYAGIGYFTLPVLVHAGAAHVHAAEWNPDAVACLRVNLALAGVEARCSVWPGDNGTLLARAPALLGCADRVLLGLIPSSRSAWGTALRVLRPRGGMLHVHYNVSEDGAAQFAAGDLLPALQRLAAEDGALAAHGWAFALRHCERVKSYAPRVAHFVFDVEVTQQQN